MNTLQTLKSSKEPKPVATQQPLPLPVLGLWRVSIGLFISTALLGLSGCGSVEIRDFEACADFGEDAHCARFLDDETRDISPEEWQEMRVGRVSISAEDFAEIKAEIEQLCSAHKCKYEDSARGFFRRMRKVR
jgi:hypothetical protein